MFILIIIIKTITPEVIGLFEVQIVCTKKIQAPFPQVISLDFMAGFKTMFIVLLLRESQGIDADLGKMCFNVGLLSSKGKLVT